MGRSAMIICHGSLARVGSTLRVIIIIIIIIHLATSQLKGVISERGTPYHERYPEQISKRDPCLLFLSLSTFSLNLKLYNYLTRQDKTNQYPSGYKPTRVISNYGYDGIPVLSRLLDQGRY